ncbi:MAG TPA: nucleoside transporter [Alteromonas sp.]|uniref:Nucleoside transporter n=1 Tax=Alteromonas australica TaxID=589873 RepID=A0A358E3P8_9ALTE|nr:nucleoside transporter [Alteromonas macleodii]HBA56391.1 nucleoside transporter [Alteromonas macleodii]HBU53146.1 nucleoside transporter [Alteromonas australica]HBY39701.1 nucleoside transporter [Alteromonas sp.]|tara:strand:- start:3084 stop:4730 length:1647 start_codon:yes stop_codon:yes gene_type:complete
MLNEFEMEPVAPESLKSSKSFIASFAGEHVAGTEFVIGALFVSWGVSTGDLLIGLLIGNTLAVLTWALITAPIATDTRLTLYAYLEKIAGPGTIKVYSLVNGVLFCILAGAMVTVSASAVRVLFDLPAQVNWYPTDAGFVIVALTVGAVVSYIAMNGFTKVTRFAEVCAPWMILMFIIGAVISLPVLVAQPDSISQISNLNDLYTLAESYIWVESQSDIGLMHVAAFAWVANLSMHGSLGDLTLLRYAKRSHYGYYSSLGMFIGHYLAWICAGVMGAAAGLLLNQNVTQLDAGEVAFQTLGLVGILAVIIAGWTTSNPTIYRAGLAFQSINHKWNRKAVTLLTGIVTTIIACFPFVFTGLLDFVGVMGLMLSPVGAVIVTEHWIFPRLGLTRYWNSYKRNTTNYAAIISWLSALSLAMVLNYYFNIHLFFLVVPVWIWSTLCYLGMSFLAGAKQTYEEAEIYEKQELSRKEAESKYLNNEQLNKVTTKKEHGNRMCEWVANLSLLSLAFIASGIFLGLSHNSIKMWLIFPTIIYFVSASYRIFKVRDT